MSPHRYRNNRPINRQANRINQTNNQCKSGRARPVNAVLCHRIPLLLHGTCLIVTSPWQVKRNPKTILQKSAKLLTIKVYLSGGGKSINSDTNECLAPRSNWYLCYQRSHGTILALAFYRLWYIINFPDHFLCVITKESEVSKIRKMLSKKSAIFLQKIRFIALFTLYSRIECQPSRNCSIGW